MSKTETCPECGTMLSPAGCPRCQLALGLPKRRLRWMAGVLSASLVVGTGLTLVGLSAMLWFARGEPAPTTTRGPHTSVPSAVVVAPRPIAMDRDHIGCEDLPALAGPAAVGTLSVIDVACLERRLGGAEAVEASHLLISQAFATGDEGAWERRVEAHLSELDPGDPELSLRMARRRASQEDWSSVIRHADTALAGAAVWSGTTYDSRLCRLHALRAQATRAQWLAAQARYDQRPAPETRSELFSRRELAWKAAEAWLSHDPTDQGARLACVEVALKPAQCGMAREAAAAEG